MSLSGASARVCSPEYKSVVASSSHLTIYSGAQQRNPVTILREREKRLKERKRKGRKEGGGGGVCLLDRLSGSVGRQLSPPDRAEYSNQLNFTLHSPASLQREERGDATAVRVELHSYSCTRLPIGSCSLASYVNLNFNRCSLLGLISL